MQTSWIWVLVFYLLMMSHSYLKSSVTGVFEMSFERVGPTEARIGMILMNSLVFFTRNPVIMKKPISFNLLDAIGFLAACILAMLLAKSIATSLWGKNKIKG